MYVLSPTCVFGKENTIKSNLIKWKGKYGFVFPRCFTSEMSEDVKTMNNKTVEHLQSTISHCVTRARRERYSNYLVNDSLETTSISQIGIMLITIF